MIVDIEKGEAELLAYCERTLRAVDLEPTKGGTIRYKPYEIGAEADTKQPWKSPAGPSYQEIGAKIYYPTYDAVMEAAKKAFDDYAEGKKGKLYWRKRPELDHNTDGWRFYMRLVIA